MKFNKFNRRKKHHKKMSYADACIYVGKNMLMDKAIGYDFPVSVYEDQAERLSGRKQK